MLFTLAEVVNNKFLKGFFLGLRSPSITITGKVNQMPFFVEALSLKLGVGTSTESSDTDALAGSASSMEAEWAYSF